MRAEPFEITASFEPLWVDLDRAHALLDVVTITDVRAVSIVETREWDRASESIRRVSCEDAWSVSVLGYTQDDAAEAMDALLEALRDDIHAGRVERGMHPGRPVPRDPLEPPVEALLREYREKVLCDLGRSSSGL